jgi:hypothetical protein
MVGKLQGRFLNVFMVMMHVLTSWMKSEVKTRVKKIIPKKTLMTMTTKTLSIKRMTKGKMMQKLRNMRKDKRVRTSLRRR